MERFNFFIEQNWMTKLKKEMKNHGFNKVAPFVRFIIIKFFEDIGKDKKGSDK